MSTQGFHQELARAGLDYSGPIVADGKLHRFKAGNDRERNSWYLLYAGPPMSAAYGCWKRGIKGTFCAARNGELSQSEWARVREQWRLAEIERDRVETERHLMARKTTARILSRAQKADFSHAYLLSKGVRLFGDVLEYRGALVLPLRDADGELHSLQFIGTDGTKRFLSGGRIAGCYFALCDKPCGPIVIVEGCATGSSVHDATDHAVVCAMHAGNLLAVAQALRSKWPDRDIIIAGDNDQFTDGNPGVTKATEAAIAIGARLAVPHFADMTSKPTDFNDLHRLEGLDSVKKQIENAATPKESDDEIIARLAMLPPLDYERQREDAAKHLGSRTAILDRLVDARRPKAAAADGELQGRTMNLTDVELWPESVNGADVLGEVAETFRRYVALPDGAADALALWVAHAHIFESFICSPRLNISSPEKGCGKTTLRDVVAVVVPRPLLAENLSTAVLFRVVAAHRPTLLADECDSWLRDNEELRGMLNSGHRRGGQALRCEGDNHEVRAFSVFGPAVLCGIGALPGTLHDRSIIVRLERAKPGELCERFDSRRVEKETELCRKLARFAADHRAAFDHCDPGLPSVAQNRRADNWRPLFAIAEIAGGDWPVRATAAFTKLNSREDSDAQGLGVMLMADIRLAFGETHEDRMFSKALVVVLCAMTERPWPEAHRGKPITETWLARRLKSFGIVSRTLRIGSEQAKGYHLSDFEDVFARYLPEEGESKRPNVPSPANIDNYRLSEASQAETVGRMENAVPANKDGPWDVGTDGNPETVPETQGELL